MLRLLIPKHVRDWCYQTLEREVRANLVYRSFARIGSEKVPDAKTLGRLGQVISGDVVADLHQRVVERPVPAKPDTTDKQAKFCKVIAVYRTDVMRAVNEPNPIIRAGMHKPAPADYDGRLAAILGTSGEFDSWRGTVRFHVAGQWVVLEFTPDCKTPQAIAFATANSAQMRDGTQTLIPLKSPLARTLSRVKSNDSVMVSGHLLYTGGKSAYRGSPDNPNPSVAVPRYLAAFNNVTVMPK